MGEEDDGCRTAYLRNYFEPGIYLYSAEPAGNRMTDFVMSSKLEPQCQKPESVLESVFAA